MYTCNARSRGPLNLSWRELRGKIQRHQELNRAVYGLQTGTILHRLLCCGDWRQEIGLYALKKQTVCQSNWNEGQQMGRACKP
jgi:hypothetical protein